MNSGTVVMSDTIWSRGICSYQSSATALAWNSVENAEWRRECL